MPDLLSGYTFDDRSCRYRSLTTGRYVARGRIVELLDAQIQQRGSRLARLTMDYAANKLTPRDWIVAMRDELRRAHLQYASLGRGGWDRLAGDAKAYGRIGGILQADYRRLLGFADDIANGRLSDAQILNRLEMYLGNARREFWENQRDGLRASGQRYEARRVLQPAEHCEDCIVMAREGWKPIEQLVMPGEGSRCLTNCKCVVDYRIAK